MRLPAIRIKKQEPACRQARLSIKNYFSYLFLTVIFLISLFVYPRKVLADFAGGINIGDHYDEFDRAAQTGATWIYVMMKPQDADKLVAWQNQFPTIKIMVRGHYPDQGGSSLTADYAREWAEKLKNLSRPVYFVPVNEPNNPSESVTGVPASKVKEYTENLINELTAKNLLTGPNKKVILLSPSIDIFTLSDSGSQYITDLGGWSYFQKFEGICLNLYGQFDGNVVDSNAPLIKKGQGYREFLKTNFGADEAQSQSMKIYACETGVLKLQDAKVKYKENAAEIVTYFNLMKTVWGNDPNFVMYAIFSYDPANYSAPSWIYSEKEVLTTMGLTGGPTISPTPASLSGFSSEYDIAKGTNKYLLPKSVQDAKLELEGQCPGIRIGKTCIDIIGSITAFFTGRNPKENLASETDYLQAYSVSTDKKVNIEAGNEVKEKVPQQVVKEETGAFNMFRPSNLDFKAVADSGRNLALGNQDSNVLGVFQTPEGEVKSGFYNTLKMLLPFSMSSKLTKPVETTPPPQYPTATPPPGGYLTPTPNPQRPACPEGHDYCSVETLSTIKVEKLDQNGDPIIDDNGNPIMISFPDENSARIASKICQRESRSELWKYNKGCLTGQSVDYSIGLFQINLLSHYAVDAFTYTWDPPSCTILNQAKVDRWESILSDPLKSISLVIIMSVNGTNWGPWDTATGCDIYK